MNQDIVGFGNLRIVGVACLRQAGIDATRGFGESSAFGGAGLSADRRGTPTRVTSIIYHQDGSRKRGGGVYVS